MSALDSSTVVGVVGAGAMGTGIAQVAVLAGHPVLIYDVSPEATANAIDGIAKRLERFVEKGRLSAGGYVQALAGLKTVDSLEAMAPVGLVVEAVAENLEIKRKIFQTLAQACGEKTIFATNTSSLSINAISRDLACSARVVGMHFFNPAPIMALVEVVSGLSTLPEVASSIFDTALAWGKSPVRAKSTPGFIVNRVARPFYGVALSLIDENAVDPATVDAIMRDCGGFRMGPLELIDLIGLDVNYAVTCSTFEAFYGDPRYKPSQTQKTYVDAGRLGRKSGQGFYDYGGNAEQGAASIGTAEPAEPAEMPAYIRIYGDLGIAEPLVSKWEAAGILVERHHSETPNISLKSGGCLAMTDGRTAAQRTVEAGVPFVLYDLANDFEKAGRVALSEGLELSNPVMRECVGLFQAAGKEVSLIADMPGMIVMRTVARLVNEASDIVHQGIATAEDVDIAMKKGVNYPAGPLDWGGRIGWRFVLQVLDNMEAFYRDGSHRASPRLRRLAMMGEKAMTGEEEC